jgi:hypothetical protein
MIIRRSKNIGLQGLMGEDGVNIGIKRRNRYELRENIKSKKDSNK